LNVKRANIAVILEKPIPTIGLESKADEMSLSEEAYKAIEKHYIDQ
jgi:hypothetical protein